MKDKTGNTFEIYSQNVILHVPNFYLPGPEKQLIDKYSPIRPWPLEQPEHTTFYGQLVLEPRGISNKNLRAWI